MRCSRENVVIHRVYNVPHREQVICVRPKIRLQHDEPVQVHMGGTNPKE